MVGKDENKKTWFAQVLIKDPVTGKRRYKKKRGFKFKREAEKWELEYKNQNVKSEKYDHLTFMDIFYLWCDYLQTSTETKKQKESLIKMYFQFSEKPITLLTKDILIKWSINKLNQEKLAIKTKNSVIQIVKSVCRFATDLYGIPNASILLKKFKKPINEYIEMETWTPEEFSIFRKCVENELYGIYFEVLYWTGARRGEILALTKDCVEENGTLKINKSIKSFKRGIKSPKTRSSFREIELDKMTFEHMKPLLKTPGAYVFGGEQTLSLTNIARKFNEAIKKAGIKKIRLHDLRHSHATMLINNGANIVAVSKRLGHSSVDQTLKTYTHLFKETNQSMIETISNLHEKIN